ncbi:MAG: hypothetical protein Q4C70_13150, partial [Planctomycetia bacterium]|nr:hypothetical protein [Planctomycetia bacterium]
RNTESTENVVNAKENVFPAENIQVRLVTYRDIRYPRYSSKENKYRVLPEYLQDVTVTDATALEPQRYFVTFYVPAGMKAGKYFGKIHVSWGENADEGAGEEADKGKNAEARSAEIPVMLRVLDFELLRDPTKNYSAYYYVKKKADGTWDEEIMEREFAAMRDYGFTRSPVYHMAYNGTEKRFYFPDLDKWVALMKKNNMTGPIPVLGGGGTWHAEQYYGAKFASHIRVLTPPREEFYTEWNRICKEIKKEVDALPEGTPELIFGPLDETSPEATEFGTRVYKAFHDAGLTTYTTKEPSDPTFLAYDDVVDIYASQVFNPTYQEIQKRHKREYWCYPNHNSYERKDMVIMCKGGRMTYGFGFWRSGFDLLIPWIWRANNPNHFDLNTSSGANIIHPETGEVIMATYWECFREGISDLRYLYTLENYVIQREGGTDEKLNAEIKESRALLQEIWDSVVIQEKYLNKDLWESTRFDEYRERLAKQIVALSKWEPLNDKTAPSVIIEPRVIERVDAFQEECKRRLAENTLQKLTFTPESCRASEDEAKVEVVTGDAVPAGAQNEKVALLTVTIDKNRDGSAAKGLYPSNWPALATYISEKAYENFGNEKPRGLLLRLYVDSNRTKDADKTPIHVGVQPGAYAYDFGKEMEPKKWHTVFVPFENSGYEGMPPISGLPTSVRLTISESNHENGDVLKIYFDEISFIK